jgi:hypothetical protein
MKRSILVSLRFITTALILLSALPIVSSAFQIPDTGQTKCYNDIIEIPCPSPGEPYYGQDAQYQGPVPSYTKLDANDGELPDTATPADGWIMTRDNITGLTWEIKTDDGGLHDKDNTYPWCDTNPATNGGDEGYCVNIIDTEDFITALNVANYGGHRDWRLPTVKELSTLMDSTIPYPGPTIKKMFFPKTVSSNYCSSTTVAFLEDFVWIVHFSYGAVIYSGKSTHYYVRAVRGGQ